MQASLQLGVDPNSLVPWPLHSIVIDYAVKPITIQQNTVRYIGSTKSQLQLAEAPLLSLVTFTIRPEGT